MAKVEFSVAWWKKHSAKTLTDTGMSAALRTWESAKKVDAKPTIDALTALHKVADAAEKKADKRLHKETIVLLQTYQKMCVDFVGRLKDLDDSKVNTLDKLLTKPMLAELAADEKGKQFVDELTYLFVTKGNPKAASDGIYKTFIKAGAQRQVNIDSSDLVAECDRLAAAGTWQDDGWQDARDEISRMVRLNMEKIEKVLAEIQARPVLKEIRAA